MESEHRNKRNIIVEIAGTGAIKAGGKIQVNDDQDIADAVGVAKTSESYLEMILQIN